jgi:hypothetical protein
VTYTIWPRRAGIEAPRSKLRGIFDSHGKKHYRFRSLTLKMKVRKGISKQRGTREVKVRRGISRIQTSTHPVEGRCSSHRKVGLSGSMGGSTGSNGAHSLT